MCGRADDTSMIDVEVKPTKPWGEVWGAPFVRQSDGAVVLMRRKAQRVRFFAGDEQVGPEHRNVAPALIWAWSKDSPLADPNVEPWLLAGVRRQIEGEDPEVIYDRDDPNIDYASGGGY